MCSLNCQAATNSHLQWILTGTVYLYICGGSYRVQRTCTSAVDPKDYSALVTIKFSEALPLLTHAHTVTVLIATVTRGPGKSTGRRPQLKAINFSEKHAFRYYFYVFQAESSRSCHHALLMILNRPPPSHLYFNFLLLLTFSLVMLVRVL